MQTIPINEIPVKVQSWLEKTRELGQVFNQLGAIGRGLGATRTTGRANNGGTAATLAPMVKDFVATQPGATRRDIAAYVQAQGIKVNPVSLHNTLTRLRAQHELTVKGRRGAMKFYASNAP